MNELGKDYYESGVIATSTDKWRGIAEKALEDRSDVVYIGLSDFRNSCIDWEQFFKHLESVNNPSTIIFNKDITISDIPEKAYQYVVNGCSAIKWIMN